MTNWQILNSKWVKWQIFSWVFVLFCPFWSIFFFFFLEQSFLWVLVKSKPSTFSGKKVDGYWFAFRDFKTKLLFQWVKPPTVMWKRWVQIKRIVEIWTDNLLHHTDASFSLSCLSWWRGASISCPSLSPRWRRPGFRNLVLYTKVSCLAHWASRKTGLLMIAEGCRRLNQEPGFDSGTGCHMERLAKPCYPTCQWFKPPRYRALLPRYCRSTLVLQAFLKGIQIFGKI